MQKLLAVAALFLLCSMTVFSGEITLKNDIIIPFERNRILLSDFVQEDGRELGNMGSVVFGYAPLPGKTMRVSTVYVVRKFERYLNSLTINYDPEGSISVYRSVSKADTGSEDKQALTVDKQASEPGMITYNEESFKGLLKKTFISWLEMDLNVEEITYHFEEIPDFPFEASELDFSFQKYGLEKYRARFTYKDKTGRLNTGGIFFRPEWITDIAVAGQDIKRETLLSTDYVYFDQFNYFDFRDPVIKEKMPQEFVTRFRIREGDVIEWRDLERRSYVLRGQIISAVIETAGMKITSKVELLENAELGQVARARNVDTGIIITGLVAQGPVLKVDY